MKFVRNNFVDGIIKPVLTKKVTIIFSYQIRLSLLMRLGKENCRFSAVKVLYIFSIMIGHEIKYHEYIHMLQLDKTLANVFSLKILKTKINVLIKLH